MRSRPRPSPSSRSPRGGATSRATAQHHLRHRAHRSPASGPWDPRRSAPRRARRVRRAQARTRSRTLRTTSRPREWQRRPGGPRETLRPGSCQVPDDSGGGRSDVTTLLLYNRRATYARTVEVCDTASRSPNVLRGEMIEREERDGEEAWGERAEKKLKRRPRTRGESFAAERAGVGWAVRVATIHLPAAHNAEHPKVNASSSSMGGARPK